MIAIEGYKTKYKVLSAASGASRPVGTGDTVTVHATGVYYFKKEAGKTFWSTRDSGEPLKYTAGVGEVITGWDQACLGMQVGEMRSVDIPSDEGYGVNGCPDWGIPPNSRLVFEIEVLNVEAKGLFQKFDRICATNTGPAGCCIA